MTFVNQSFLSYLKTVVAILFMFGAYQNVFGQMSAPVSVCQNQQFELASNSSGSVTEINWDFCEGDLLLIPQYQQRNVPDFNIPVGTSLIKANNKWYGFVCSQSNNSLIRIDFDASLSNPSPVVVNLGNLGGLLNSPQDIQVMEYQSNFYAFVFNISGNKLIRINLGANIETSTASSVAVLTGSGFTNGGMEIIHDGTQWLTALTNSNTVTLANLGASPLTIPLLSDVITTAPIAGLSSIGDIKFVKEEGTWYGFVVGYNSNTLHRLTFGPSLYTNPTASNLFTFASSPYGLSINNDNGNWIMHIVTLQGNLMRVNLGTSIADNDLSFSSLGNLGGLNNLLKLDMALDGSRWYMLTAAWNSKNYTLLEFPQAQCNFNQSSSSLTNPIIQATGNGFHQISLREKNNDGSVSIQRNIIQTITTLAPNIDFSTTSICEGVAGDFSIESNQMISNASWSFEDNGNSNLLSPNVQYDVAGVYTVKVVVIAETGCSNLIFKDIEVYQPPGNPSFVLPTGLICTNNEFTFVNNTIDNFDGNLSFQWLLDDVPVSTDEDLLYTFTTGGDKELTLRASIPGCTSESVQVLSGVGEGPIVNFTTDGVCVNESMQLTNNSQGDIASYAWNFGDGQSSSDTSPAVNYAAAGNYIIELQALGTNGCLSTKSLSHQIFSAPQPNFNTDLPPFSCSGTPTQFNDLTSPLTDSNLNAWSWDFGDQNSNAVARHPQHTYALSGDYSVSLTATSDKGCVATLNKIITIAQSPQPTISNTPACIETAVILQDVSLTSASAWQWQVGNNFYFTESPSHVFSDAGDYEISLTVTASNGCVGTSTKQINVPLPLLVDFESAFNCANTPTQFTALINDSSDPILTHTWTFAEEEKNGIHVNHLYNQTGIQEVKLTAMATSGCVYSITKVVDILPAPIANFSFTPLSGSPPLAVTFTNLSTDATSFEWQFNDANNTTSNLNNPSFTFTEAGEYAVDLTVANAAGCESTISKLIAVAFPFVNLTLDNFRIISNTDGSFLLLINIRNNGNVLVQNPRIEIQLDNTATLQEVVNTSIGAGDSFDYTLSTVVASNNLNYACVRLLLPNNEAQENTEACLTFNSGTALTSPYPNPANDFVTVEWICAAEEQVLLAVNDNLGNVMATENISAKQGLNTIVLQTIDWQAGIYFIRLKSASKEHYFRTIIAR